MNIQRPTIPQQQGRFQALRNLRVASPLNKLNLRNKLIAAFLVISLISIGIMTLVANNVIRNDLTRSMGANLKNSARSLGQTIGDQLVAQVDILSILGASPDIIKEVEHANATYSGLDSATIQANIDQLDQQWIAANNDSNPLIRSRLDNLLSSRLRDFRNFNLDHVEVFITDKYGALIAATNRTSDYNQNDETWWQESHNNGQGAMYIGQLEYEQSSGNMASAIAIPIYDNAHRLIGILHSTYRVNALAYTLQLTHLGQTGENDLLLPNNATLGMSGKTEELDADTANKLLSVVSVDYAQFFYHGMDRLVSVASVTTRDSSRAEIINKLNWKVVATQDSAEALEPVNSATRTSLLTGLLVLALAFLAAIFVAQSLSSPIIRLTKIAEQVSVGDLSAQALAETNDEIGTLALAFNKMTAQLSDQINNLEQKVAERTSAFNRRAVQLQVAADTGKAITSIRNVNELLERTCYIIAGQFGFYHVGIFLLNSSGDYAVLHAANSEGGKRMLARGHKLKVGETGIVGYVTQAGKARIALDVGHDATFFDNPDLPKTRSEMALPLIAGGQILGALDVQSAEAEAFLEDDIAILQVVADQLSIAMQNARLFDESQAALETASRAYGEVSHADWQKLLKSREQAGYTIGTQGFAQPSEPRWEEYLAQALQSGSIVPAQEGFTINLPLKVRGESIGAIRLKKSENSQPWSQDETSMAISLAEQLSSALESARLFQDAQVRATREALVSEISTRINSTSHVDTILRETVQELGHAFGNTTVSFHLLDVTPTQGTKE